MASATSTSDSHQGSQQRSILCLDKSTEPYASQLIEICSILDIQLGNWTSTSLLGASKAKLPQYDGPREEWALRWLLKKLQSEDVGFESPCVILESWILLYELIIRTTLRNTARLLNAHQFTVTLEKTLQWLNAQSTNLTDFAAHTNKNDVATTETSLIAKPLSISGRGSKKRKRNGLQTAAENDRSSFEINLELLYMSICSVVKRLVTLIDDLSAGPHGFVLEYLRNTLKTTPMAGAIILGSSTALADKIVANGVGARSYEKAQIVEACVSCVIDFWTFCLPAAAHQQEESTVSIFSNHCLLPILSLIAVYQDLSISYFKFEVFVRSLKTLLVRNIILPARNSYLRSEILHETDSKDELSPLTRIIWSPLAKAYANVGGTFYKEQRSFVFLPIPLLLNIAIRSFHPLTPKQSLVEASWFQVFFSHLIQCASQAIVPKPSVNQLKWYMLTLYQMLREISDQNIRLSTSHIEAILSQVLSVMQDDINEVIHWELIGVILEIDANIFIVPSSREPEGQGEQQHVPNKNLSSLLSLITKSSWKRHSETGVLYDIKLSKVILPLAEALAKARALSRFIVYWQGQLVSCQGCRRSCREDSTLSLSRNIWEDEKLLQLVARLVESTLTVGQIEHILHRCTTSIISFESAPSNDNIEPAAFLITLDCFMGVNFRESTLDQLQKKEYEIYIQTLNSIISQSHWSMENKWRLWRILTSFNERWPSSQEWFDLSVAEQQAMRKALELVTQTRQISAGSLSTTGQDMEITFAFTFIISLSTRQQQKDKHRASTALLIEDFLCEDLLAKGPVFSAQCNGDSITRTGLESLLLQCFSQVLAFPEILSCLNGDQQHRFFRCLYKGAVAVKASYQPSVHKTSSEPIDYVLLWEKLLGLRSIQEIDALARTLRHFVVSEYLAQTAAEDSTFWAIETINYEHAFDSLQRISVSLLTRNQKKMIFDRILRTLIERSFSSSTLVYRHIGLLVHYSDYGVDPSRCLGTTLRDDEDEALQGLNKERIPLFVLARNLDDQKSRVVDCGAVLGLKRLAELALRHCVRTISHDRSVALLEKFFQQLTKKLDDFNLFKGDTTSMLLATSLNVYFCHISEFPETTKLKYQCLESFRRHHLEQLCDSVRVCHQETTEIQRPDLVRQLVVTSECMALYTASQDDRALVTKVWAQLSSIMEVLTMTKIAKPSKDTKAFKNESSCIDCLSVSMKRLELVLDRLDQTTASVLLSAIQLSRALQLTAERKRLLSYVQETISVLDAEHRVKLIQDLTKNDKVASLDVNSIYLLHRVISSFKDLRMQPEAISAVLVHSFTILSFHLARPIEFRYGNVLVQCMSMILHKQPSIISQWHIDTTLAGISVISATIALANKDRYTGAIFTSLCTLFNNILVIHRMKLGGRYHLVLSALQGLLRCLFVPYAKSHDILEENEPSSALGEAHAIVYGRLLTTICNPAVSAVTQSKRHSRLDLNDETKKARSIAGQYLQYLIMGYCDCQLKGRLTPAVKAALAPGLYGIFDVMSPNVMHTINSAMNSSGRSIFKALFEDYQRFGR